MNSLAARAQEVRDRITQACVRADRAPVSVELLAVSKFQPVALIKEAMTLGFPTFGENYVQEGAQKAQELPDAAFTLIGPLQRNKAKPALMAFREIMTVDRPELATRLRHLAAELDLQRTLWIQVNLWDEASKWGGCSEAALPALVAALGSDPRLPLHGFMAIPPPGHTSAFHELHELRTRWQDRLGCPLKLSMGMSDDLEDAIAAGSDQVRIGTALFGHR